MYTGCSNQCFHQPMFILTNGLKQYWLSDQLSTANQFVYVATSCYCQQWILICSSLHLGWICQVSTVVEWHCEVVQGYLLTAYTMSQHSCIPLQLGLWHKTMQNSTFDLPCRKSGMQVAMHQDVTRCIKMYQVAYKSYKPKLWSERTALSIFLQAKQAS